jgi:hypothetical protein
LIKRKNVEDKFDYNFGNKFDTELHIKTLAKNTREKALLEQPQDEINDILEEKENEKEKEMEMEKVGKRLSLRSDQRSRKQTDKGFFVSF